MRQPNLEPFTRVIFGILLGMAAFFFTQTAVLTGARLASLDFRRSWLFLLPVALFAGLVAGATSRRWGFAVGAAAASWWLVAIIVAGLAVRIVGGPFPKLDLGMASLLLHPLLGGLGGWVGARHLPPIPVPPYHGGRAGATTSSILILMAYVSVIAVLYTTAMPRLLLVAIVVAIAFAYSAYVWLRAKNTSERWRALFLAGMGALLALTTWGTPEPPPVSPAIALGLLTGGALGAVLVWQLALRREH